MIKKENLNFPDKNLDDICDDFNEALSFLEEQCIEEIKLCFDSPGTTKESFKFSFKLVCNAYLRRIINLARQYSKAVNELEILTCAILGRTLLESVIHFHYLISSLDKLLNSGKIAKAYYLISSYALGGQHGFSDKTKFLKLHINDSLREIEKSFPGITKSYDWLSEFIHPNSMGTTITYVRVDTQKGVMSFTEKGRSDNISPLLEGSPSLEIFSMVWKQVAIMEKLIEEKWDFSPKIHQELFELSKK